MKRHCLFMTATKNKMKYIRGKRSWTGSFFDKRQPSASAGPPSERWLKANVGPSFLKTAGKILSCQLNLSVIGPHGPWWTDRQTEGNITADWRHITGMKNELNRPGFCNLSWNGFTAANKYYFGKKKREEFWKRFSATPLTNIFSLVGMR